MDSVFRGTELTPAAIVDYGIDTPEHFEALRQAVFTGKIEAPQLDAALGHGAELTELVNRVDCNPHGVVFHTSWDAVFGRERVGEKAAEPEPRERAMEHEQEL